MGPAEDGSSEGERAERGPSARLTAARQRVLAEHRGTLAATLDAADAVAAGSGTDSAAGQAALSDGGALRRRLRARLDNCDLLAEYPAVLRTAVEAAGFALAADPVSAPPYVVVASRGPILRGSTSDGRLVLALRAFAVHSRDTGSAPPTDRRYVRTSSSVDDALVVTFR